MSTLKTIPTLTILILLSTQALAGESVNIVPVTDESVAIIPVTDEPATTHLSSTPSTAVTTSHSTLSLDSDGIPLTRDSSSSSKSLFTPLTTSTGTRESMSTSTTSSADPTATKTSAGNKIEALARNKVVATVAAGTVVAWIALRIFVHTCVGVPVPRLDGGIL